MAIKKKSAIKKKEIDLLGPEGNAFVLMGYAQQYARQLGLDADAIVRQMMKGDYENLIKVFDKYFGDYVDLVREERE